MARRGRLMSCAAVLATALSTVVVGPAVAGTPPPEVGPAATKDPSATAGPVTEAGLLPEDGPLPEAAAPPELDLAPTPPADLTLDVADLQTHELALAGIDEEALEQLSAEDGPEPDAATAWSDADRGVAAFDAALTAETAVLTAQEETETFDVFGVTWDDVDAGVERVEVRVRTDDAWSDWVELEIDSTTPDPGTAEAENARPGTEPYVQPGSDGIQVRVMTRDGSVPGDLSATLIDGGAASAELAQVAAPGGGRTPGSVVAGVSAAAHTTARAAVPAAAPASSLAPPIVTRAQWGADESIRRPIDWSSTVSAVVVHHTVNVNDYSRAQAPAIVRSIYSYHVKSRGWSDVGYHFLVDRFGTVYEGRKGSLDQVPLGVHTGGFNTNTMGIAVIGRFDLGTAPSQAAVRSVAQVAAWKLGTYGSDPLGTVTLTAREGSTHSVRKPGWRGAVNVISGHRDLGSTACPGQHLQARLPDIRTMAAAHLAQLPAQPEVIAAAPGDGSVGLRYYSSGSSSWTATARLACEAAPVRSWSGSGRGWVPVMWNQRTDGGGQAPSGAYEITVTATAGGKSTATSAWVEVLPPGGAGASTCGFSRHGGDNRYETAAALGRAAFPDSREVVIVAGTQESVVDGLVAAPFAHSRSAPVLLSRTADLGPVTRAEVQRRGVDRAWVVGGTGVVLTSVIQELRNLGVGQVTRVSGQDRYGTAAAVAAQMGGSHVLVASGATINLIDSAAVGGVGAARGRPVLLTRPDRVPDTVAAHLRGRSTSSVTVIGGTGAVSTAVAQELGRATGASVTRVGGDNRFETALAVADAFRGSMGSAEIMVAASPDAHLVDAVTGGVLALPTVLVPPGARQAAVESWVGRRGVERFQIAGGPGVVTPANVAWLAQASS